MYQVDNNLASLSFFVLIGLLIFEFIALMINKLKGNQYNLNLLILLLNIMYLHLSVLNLINYAIIVILVLYWTFYLLVRSFYKNSLDILLQINFYTLTIALLLGNVWIEGDILSTNPFSSVPQLLLLFSGLFSFNQYLIHKRNPVTNRNKAIEALKSKEYEQSLSNLEQAIQNSDKLIWPNLEDQLKSEYETLKNKIEQQDFKNIESTIPKKVDQKAQVIILLLIATLCSFLLTMGIYLRFF